ncbi:MAG: trypsin-like serine protease [Lachnospiraceae bacterium]|nr:trypsin-like serine protease [Lachnospiraceae bacterium]
MYDQYDYSYNTPQAPKEPEEKKKRGGFLKKALLSITLGLIFGLFAGTGFYAVNTIFDMLKGGENTAVLETQENAVTEPSNTDGMDNNLTNPLTTESIHQNITDVSGVVEKAMPTLVSITNLSTQEMRDFWGRTGRIENESSGSGIIVGQNEAELLVVTNNHVISDAQTLTVQFIDSSIAEAQLKGSNSSVDLAVIAVPLSSISEQTKAMIAVANLGDSNSLRVGEAVIAIGNSLGYGQSVTTGVVSALNREVTVDNITNELIQTDAAINPGNSGGALLNVKGELIGINSIKFAASEVEGMGYAIPISSAKPIIDELMNRATKVRVGENDSSYLGVSGLSVTKQISEAYNMPVGFYINEVYQGSAADNAGIKRGDIITAFDGEKVTSQEDLTDLMQYYAAGTTVVVTVQSGVGGIYQEREVTVVLGRKAAEG